MRRSNGTAEHSDRKNSEQCEQTFVGVVDIVSLKAGIVIPLLGNMALCSMQYCLVVRICLRLVRTCVGVVWLCRRVVGPYCSSNANMKYY